MTLTQWENEDIECPNCGRVLGSSSRGGHEVIVCDNCDYWREFGEDYVS